MLSHKQLVLLFFVILVFSCGEKRQIKDDTKIDRYALVSRHNVHLTEVDTLGSLSVGNGEFAFTVDASGLQTFPDEYEKGVSLGTMSQWGWHSIPSSEKYTLNDVFTEYESCNDKNVPYAIQHKDGHAGAATNWLRGNPHRLHLGLIGLVLQKENGDRVALSDLQNINQTLDLYSGKITSEYTIENNPVTVEVISHSENDQVSVKIRSSLISDGRLKVQFRLPYGKDCHTCPGYDFDHPEKHVSEIVKNNNNAISIEHTLDTTKYWIDVSWNEGTFNKEKDHQYILAPADDAFEFNVLFRKNTNSILISDFETTQVSSENAWKLFWEEGGAIDFSQCTDPRAQELERRVVLSQYLTRIQCAGSMPPQETGLTFNSWFGKFHLEMHWWHEVHFALWSRIDQLEKSVGWYEQVSAKAKATAQKQGYEGVRWQKMTDPYGNESPSGVGAFLVWQQPHPIYYAELLYRHNPENALNKYKEIVFQTADFMASFAQYNSVDGKYHLCHPLIPAQELFKATETNDPPFELAYWHYALKVAQEWRKRSGMEANKKWQDVIDQLAPLAIKDGLYLPEGGSVNAYTDDHYRIDHPAVTGAYGILPISNRMDTTVMRATFDEIMRHWDWPTTWGWDYPMLAMTAARLGKPDDAINALLLDVQKNTYLVNGHNYQDERLRIYLPGNGGLLTAVAMMAAGWDGNEISNPGFPKDGKWNVRWENLQKMQ